MDPVAKGSSLPEGCGLSESSGLSECGTNKYFTPAYAETWPIHHRFQQQFGFVLLVGNLIHFLGFRNAVYSAICSADRDAAFRNSGQLGICNIDMTTKQFLQGTFPEIGLLT